jgi:hypothetical protein
VDLDAEEISLRFTAREREQVIAVAETDFDYERSGATEQLLRIEVGRDSRCRSVDPVSRP